eukprot:evm.model.scf_348EXC.4 EVM.evm.TU.scf_348EXC.4   scf_348EXC:69701-71369(-)
MEPEKDRRAIFTPLVPHWGSWGNKTNVAYPVFVNPRCADGKSCGRKLLLGVIGKEVTLRELKEEDGLGQTQVENMINENLAKARVCNEAYRYDQYKLQEMRGPMSECPARLWSASDAKKCYAFKGVRYALVPETASFEEARQRCNDMGGRLAEPSVDQVKEDLHFLASIVPPDGAWIGLRPGDPWEFLDSSKTVGAHLKPALQYFKQ